MVRLPDWPKRLSDFIANQRKEDFRWGENDCILFVAKGIEAMTGERLYGEYVGYYDKYGAQEVLKKPVIIRPHIIQGV